MSEGTVTSSIFIICMTVLIILCAGDPDLLDAIVEWIGRH